MVAETGSDDKNQTTVVNRKAAMEAWIDYCAVGGVITNSDGKITTMTIPQFSQQVGVPERTLYHWRKQTPDFGERVRARREAVWPVARETALFNRLYVISMTGNGQPAVDAAKVLLGHFDKLQLPVQRTDVKVEGSFLDMMTAAARDGIIEGEIVDATHLESEAHPSRGLQDPGALPAES